jgi:zinc transporter ZupT
MNTFNAFGAYAVVAAASSAASVLIALIGIKTYTTITDSGLWSIAAMVAAPMLMAFGVSYFINESHRVKPPREPERRPPDDPYGQGAFTPERR